jgi:hypothetical protein
MTGGIRMRLIFSAWLATLIGAVFGLGIPAPVALATGQAAVVRPLGTIKTISGNDITLTTDAKAEINVTVKDGARIVQVEPGQKDLKGATPVKLQDLQAGDRILVFGTNASDGKSVVASAVILMKKTAIAQMQDQERQEWQRGVGGLVKSVDPAAQAVTISTGAGPTAKTVTIHVSSQTILRRYAPGSVNFEDAQPAPFDQIKPGDQLRARGQRSPDGTEFTAQEIVSGSFRNIAGRVTSVDAAANQVTVMDLLTKKPVVVTVSANSEVRKLPAPMAQMIAMRLKGVTPGAAPGGQAGGAARGTQAGSGGQSLQGGAGGRPQYPGGGAGASGWHGNGNGGGTPDFQQMLQRLPAATVSDIAKGDAVMIVSTQGTTGDGVTAITVLAGVEPILTAPASAQAMVLSPWSLGGPSGGGGDETAAGP